MISQLAHPLVGALAGLTWMDPNWLLSHFGGWFFLVCLVIVFVECGLFFPILPGDTLLFAVGLFVAGHKSIVPGPTATELPVALVLLFVAALAGNLAGYTIGRAVGPPLYERNGRIIKRSYFDQTTAFFERHGNKALVIGRFVPFVRTYVTVVAGVSRMSRRRFLTWSAVGAAAWVLLVTLAGYFLGSAFPSLGSNIDKVILVILALSVLPIAYEFVKHRREIAREARESSDAD